MMFYKPTAFLVARFKSFNMQFEELCMRQCEWTVPDQELRESLRLAVAEVLLPAYRYFIKRFGYVLSNREHYILMLPLDPFEITDFLSFISLNPIIFSFTWT